MSEDEGADTTWSFTAPLRMHHVSGGLAFLTGRNKLCMVLGPGADAMRPFTLATGVSTLALFRGYRGLRVLGRTTYEFAEDMKEPITDNFIIGECDAKQHCLAQTQQQHWCGVSNGLSEAGSEAHLARRLASQIRTCTQRLERLSLAYRTVLSILGPSDETDARSITNSKYAQHIGIEYRSLLNELFGLRDAIIAMALRFLYGQKGGATVNALKQRVANDQSAFALLTKSSMFDEGGDLLLARMALHRSIALHCLGATNPFFGDGYQRRIETGPYGKLSFLTVPIIDDIGQMRAIERDYSKGSLDNPKREDAESFLKQAEHLDALEFSYDCFVRLLRMAELLASEVGLASRPLTITDEDILDATFTRGGRVTRVRRDATTGKLVEY